MFGGGMRDSGGGTSAYSLVPPLAGEDKDEWGGGGAITELGVNAAREERIPRASSGGSVHTSPGLTRLADGHHQASYPSDPTAPSIPVSPSRAGYPVGSASGSPPHHPYIPPYQMDGPPGNAARLGSSSAAHAARAASSSTSPPVAPRSPRVSGSAVSPVGGGGGPGADTSPYSSSAEIEVLRELVDRYRTEMDVKRSEMGILRSENAALAEEIHSVMLENAALKVQACSATDGQTSDRAELAAARDRIMRLESQVYRMAAGLRQVATLSSGVVLPSPEQLMRELIVVQTPPVTPTGSFRGLGGGEKPRLPSGVTPLKPPPSERKGSVNSNRSVSDDGRATLPKPPRGVGAGGGGPGAQGGPGGGLVLAGGRGLLLLGEVFGEWARHAMFMRMSGLRERFSCLAFLVGKGGAVSRGFTAGRMKVSEVAAGGAIGTGVFATVHEGVWKLPCAIKRMKPSKDPATARAHLDAFVREGEILRAIDHPNIVRLLGVVAEADYLGFVLERAVGENLGEAIHKHRRKVPLASQLEVASQVADALAHVHSLSLVHRDVKPDNIILNLKDMTCRLVDFGLSRALPPNRPSVITEPGGTPAYWPPEVLSTGATQRVHVCRRADQYGFAVTFWELFTLKLPYTGVSIEQLVSMVIHDQRPAIPTDMPKGYASLIQRCWAGSVDDRPEFTEVVKLLSDARVLLDSM